MIKKIWADPVLSKVISVAILALITLAYTTIQSITEDVSFSVALQTILYFEIPLIYLLGGLIILYFSNRILKWKRRTYSAIQKKIMQFNKLSDAASGVIYKWEVFFDDNNTPFIQNLTVFCNKHGEIPIRFYGDKCQEYDCENAVRSIDMYKLKNYIESLLIHEWENINRK